jgi:hypothetical protein
MVVEDRVLAIFPVQRQHWIQAIGGFPGPWFAVFAVLPAITRQIFDGCLARQICRFVNQITQEQEKIKLFLYQAVQQWIGLPLQSASPEKANVTAASWSAA